MNLKLVELTWRSLVVAAVLTPSAPVNSHDASVLPGTRTSNSWSWTNDGFKGHFSTKTAGTTVSGSPTENISSGKILVAYCVSKQTSHSSVTDSQSNSWTKLDEGGANGVTVSIWISKLTTGIADTDTITLTTSASVGAKGVKLQQFTAGAEKTFSFVDSAGDTGTDVEGYATLTGLANSEHLFLGVVAVNYSIPVDSPPAFYASGLFTGGNPLSSNFTSTMGSRIATATGETYGDSWGAEMGYAAVIVAVDEVDE